MGGAVSIRRVKSGDANVLAYIQTESWKSAFSHILSKEDLKKYTNLARATDMYNKLLNEEIGNGYILTVDDSPHCIAFWDKARGEEADDYAELICIHSLSKNWGKGYGTKMINHILSDIKSSGYETVVLWVFKENKRACCFYEQHGFSLTNKTKLVCHAEAVMYSRQL